MRTFQDFVEHCAAQIQPFNEIMKGSPIPVIPPLSESHLFYLGEDEKLTESSKAIKEDLLEDLREGVPMPFDDVACVSKVGGNWTCDRILKGKEHPMDLSEVREKLATAPADRLIEPERYWIVRQQEPSANVPLVWPIVYGGVASQEALRLVFMTNWFTKDCPYLATSDMAGVVTRMMNTDSSEILWDVAIISHPQNYIVKVTPSLSPREERHVAKGSPRPIRKAPHFIVVDHDILVDMSRKEPAGTHSSPVPHHRRGHWKRLGERCRHARLLGKDKVFVRPTYVGETTFSDVKNHYEVLLDFGNKVTR